MKKLFVLLVLFMLSAVSVSASIMDYDSLKDDSLIVIGENAKADDVIGSVALATDAYTGEGEQSSLAQMASAGMIHIPDGLDNTVALIGDVVRIGNEADPLKGSIKLGAVTPVLTGDDAAGLSSGQIVEGNNVVHYNQYLRFHTTSNTSASDYVASGYSTFTKNDLGEIGSYLIFDDGDKMFEYEVHFEEGLESDIDCIIPGCSAASTRILTDLTGKMVKMLGNYFIILNGYVNTATNLAQIRLMGNGGTKRMKEGETHVFTVKGVDYEVTPLIISDQSQTVKFRVNGKLTPEFSRFGVQKFDQNVFIGVTEFLTDEAGDGTGDEIEVCIWGTDLEFTDADYTDGAFSETVQIDDKDIPGAWVSIDGEVLDTGKFRLNGFKYSLEALSDRNSAIYAPAGSPVTNHMKYPEAMLSNFWDIVSYGSSVDSFTHSSPINFLPVSDEGYKLRFQNNEGIFYGVPFLDNSNENDEGFKFGDAKRQLRFIECANSSDFCIEKGDYIVLTDSRDGYSSGSDKSVTRVVTFDGIDTGENLVTFSDVAGDEIVSTYLGTEGSGATGSINIGGQTYTFYVGGGTDYNLSFDQNSDSDVSADEVDIVVNGGGILDLGSNQNPDQNTSSIDAFNVTLTTLATRFHDNGWGDLGVPEVIYVEFTEVSGNSVDADVKATATGVSRNSFDEADGYISASWYGVSIVESEETGAPDFVKIAYPLKESFSQVFVTFGPAPYSVIPLSISPLLGSFPMETLLEEQTVDFMLASASKKLNSMVMDASGLTSNAVKPESGAITKLDSKTTSAELLESPFSVYVGGPCVNKYVASLAREGLTMSCDEWQTYPGAGMIQMVDTAFGPAVIVAGYEGADTIRASLVLQNTDEYSEELAGKDKVLIYQQGDSLKFI